MSAASETSRLLKPETPLNYKALFGVCSIIFMDICINSAITPLLPNMVGQWFPTQYIGFFTGVVVTVYYAGQILCSPFWGKLGDQYGRRPTLIAGILGNTVGVSIFGLAQSYTAVITGRTTSGVLSGASTIAKSYLGELTDETNAHKAFSKFGIAYGLAVIIGPSLGGLLAEPARWSSFDTAFWNDYPYLLPVIVLVSMSVLTFGYTLVFLPETETWLKNQKELASGQVLVTGNTEDVELLAADTLATTEEEKFQRLVGVADDSTCSKLIPAPARERNVILAIALVSLNAVIYMSYDVMFSVFLEAPEVDGGLGLSTEITGYFTSVYGLTMVIYQAKFYRTLAAKWGTRNCIIKGFQGFMVLFALFPFLSYINTAYDDWMLYIFITMFQVARGLAGSTATMSAQVLITQVTHSSVLGQVNGVANSFTALGKLTGPFFIGGIWTTCLGAFESRYPRVSVTYWVLVVVALIGVIVAKKVPKVYKVKTNL